MDIQIYRERERERERVSDLRFKKMATMMDIAIRASTSQPLMSSRILGDAATLLGFASTSQIPPMMASSPKILSIWVVIMNIWKVQVKITVTVLGMLKVEVALKGL